MMRVIAMILLSLLPEGFRQKAPSDEDIKNCVGNMPGIILGFWDVPEYNPNSIGVVKKFQRYRTIRFFNSSGAISKMNYRFDNYKAAIKKINKSRK